MPETHRSLEHPLMQSDRRLDGRKLGSGGYSSSGLSNPKSGTIKIAEIHQPRDRETDLPDTK